MKYHDPALTEQVRNEILRPHIVEELHAVVDSRGRWLCVSNCAEILAQVLVATGCILAYVASFLHEEAYAKEITFAVGFANGFAIGMLRLAVFAFNKYTQCHEAASHVFARLSLPDLDVRQFTSPEAAFQAPSSSDSPPNNRRNISFNLADDEDLPRSLSTADTVPRSSSRSCPATADGHLDSPEGAAAVAYKRGSVRNTDRSNLTLVVPDVEHYTFGDKAAKRASVESTGNTLNHPQTPQSPTVRRRSLLVSFAVSKRTVSPLPSNMTDLLTRTKPPAQTENANQKR